MLRPSRLALRRMSRVAADPVPDAAAIPASSEIDPPPVGDGVVPPEDGGEGRRTFKAEADPVAHLVTRWPKNLQCQSCQIAKAQRKPARHRLGLSPRTASFGYLTCDHIIATTPESHGLGAEREWS